MSDNLEPNRRAVAAIVGTPRTKTTWLGRVRMLIRSRLGNRDAMTYRPQEDASALFGFDVDADQKGS